MQQYALISHNCIHVKYQIAKKLGHMGKNLTAENSFEISAP